MFIFTIAQIKIIITIISPKTVFKVFCRSKLMFLVEVSVLQGKCFLLWKIIRKRLKTLHFCTLIFDSTSLKKDFFLFFVEFLRITGWLFSVTSIDSELLTDILSVVLLFGKCIFFSFCCSMHKKNCLSFTLALFLQKFIV